jgi:superfamily II DNA or RNA helicase
MHPSNLVVVDEAHLQKADTMKRIVADHKAAGAAIVLLTATPIGLAHMVDELVISGTLREYRDCKALVPAVVRSIEQPDLSKVKRNLTGEYILDGRKRKIYTQTIIGSVLDRWKRYNPDARPTMLYAPGVAESVWIAAQFAQQGVRACHVDATDCVLDGVRAKLTRAIWDEIVERFKAGSVKVICSRFKLREGVDIPSCYHAILATPIGSLASYIQTVGRVLRYSPETPDQVLITDHGGNYLRHGSPNDDRAWGDWWTLPEHVVSTMHERNIREGKKHEPIRCPKCEGERKSGIKCPHCGFEHPKSQRHIVMEDGMMVVRDGNLIARKRIRREDDTQKLWDNMYWSWKQSGKCRDKTFAQLEGFFAHVNHYHPPRDLQNMPKNSLDWWRSISDVTPQELRAAS